MKKITLIIHFEMGEDLSILNKLVTDGWEIQEKPYHDSDFGLKGAYLKAAYLEYYHNNS